MKKTIVILTTLVLCFAFVGNTRALELDVFGGVDVHGFISQGYLDSDQNNYLANDSEEGTFHFNEVGINFSKQLNEQLRIGLQLFSHDLGKVGNNEISLDWAFGDYRWRDWLGLRVGKIKAPHGLYNETRDIDMLRTSILLPQGIYNELDRDSMVSVTGGGIYGDISLKSMGDLSYQGLVGTMDVDGDTDVGAVRQFNSAGFMEVTDDFDMEETYIGSLQWQTPLEGLLLKGTVRSAKLEIDAKTTAPLAWGLIPRGTPLTYEIDKNLSFVLSAEYTWNNLVLAAEYLNTKRDYTIDLFRVDDSVEIEGYYIGATYRFTDLFELGMYYSEYYPDADDKDGDRFEDQGQPDYHAWLKDIAVSLRFDINEYWVFKLEGHFMDGAANVLSIDNPNGAEEDWFLGAAKITFSF